MAALAALVGESALKVVYAFRHVPESLTLVYAFASKSLILSQSNWRSFWLNVGQAGGELAHVGQLLTLGGRINKLILNLESIKLASYFGLLTAQPCSFTELIN